MHSTTINQNIGVDLLSPSAEISGSELSHTLDQWISIRYADIPTYLHRSEFYLSLDYNQEDEYVSIPVNCLWSGGTINNTEDFRMYLNTLNFWGVRHFTLEGLEFVFPFHTSYVSSNEMSDFSARHWDTLTDVCGADSALHGALRGVIDKIMPGELDEFGDRSGMEHPYRLSVSREKKAASRKASLIRILCRYFAREGCLDELIAMFQHGDGIWSQLTCIGAAQSGNIKCVQYLIDNGYTCDSDAAGAAAMAGHLHILRYLHNNKLGFNDNTSKWPPSVAQYAARGGHFGCLAFIHENGHPWDESAYKAAGEKGDIKILQYLHDNGCPWDERVPLRSIEHNNLNALEFMVERGCPLPASACVVASREGDLAMLKYLHECGCDWYREESDEVIHWAAGQAALYGNIDTLRYAVEHGCSLSDNMLIYVLRYRSSFFEETDRLRCIQYLIEDQSQEMDGVLFPLAFCLGYFQCIRYLLDTGCPFTITQAKPDPDFLKIDESVDPDQFYECLKHAIERGWPLDVELMGHINYSNRKQGGKFARTVEYLQLEGLWSDVVVKVSTWINQAM